MRSDIAQGEGMFRSARRRSHLDGRGPEGQPADRQDPGRSARPERRFVAALGHPYGPNAQRGVFRSADGGLTWTRTLFRDADTGAIDMAFKPGDPAHRLRRLWATRRPPWSVYPPSTGPGGGIFRSRDGGRTWTELGSSALPDHPGRIGLAVTPAEPEHPLRSDRRQSTPSPAASSARDDEGASWRKVGDDKRIWERGWYFSGVTVSPRNADELWVCDTIVLHSTDGGRTFIPQKGDPTGDDYHQLWIDPADPARRILGSDQGAQVTLNGGASWSSWYNQPTGQFYHVATDNRFPYRVYGAQQDSGAASVPSRTEEAWNGINITHFREQGAGGESDEIAPDPDDPDLIFGGRVDRLDLRTGQTRNVDPTLAWPPAASTATAATWTLPLVFGLRDHALYFGNQRIFRTTDRGEHWTPISPDLTRRGSRRPGQPRSGDDRRRRARRPAQGRGLLPSPPRRGRRATSGQGRTTGGCGEAATTAIAGWTSRRRASPPGRKLARSSRPTSTQSAPMSRSTATGWTIRRRTCSSLATAGALGARSTPASRSATRAIRSMSCARTPCAPACSSPAPSGGPSFRSTAAIAGRRSARAFLPPRCATSHIHGDDLVIATHGRGFYILDDIEPLREIAAGAIGVEPTSSPRRRPCASAPPPSRARPSPRTSRSPPIRLRARPSTTAWPADARVVEITVLDATGGLVRHYSSAEPPPAPDLAKISTAPEWLTPPPDPGDVGRPPSPRLGCALRRPQAAGRRGKGGRLGPAGSLPRAAAVDGKPFEATLTLLPTRASPRRRSPTRRVRPSPAPSKPTASVWRRRPLTIPPPTERSLLGERPAALASAVDGADGPPTRTR